MWDIAVTENLFFDELLPSITDYSDAPLFPAGEVSNE